MVPAKANGQQALWAPSLAARLEGVGGVTGILGVDQRPRFHRYVVEQHRPSYREGDVRVGAELPEAGVTYYDVPREYGAREYRTIDLCW